MRDVLTKRDFVGRFIAGEFGNRTPVWWTPDSIDVDRGLFCLRSLYPGAKTYYKLLYGAVFALWTPAHYVSCMIPERVEKVLKLQGEVMRTECGLYCYYSTVPLPMKQSLEQGGRHAWRLAAKLLLEWAMDVASYEWLQHLLDSYPDHVIEFSSYYCNYGVLPQNTLFWEVRKY